MGVVHDGIPSPLLNLLQGLKCSCSMVLAPVHKVLKRGVQTSPTSWGRTASLWQYIPNCAFKSAGKGFGSLVWSLEPEPFLGCNTSDVSQCRRESQMKLSSWNVLTEDRTFPPQIVFYSIYIIIYILLYMYYIYWILPNPAFDKEVLFECFWHKCNWSWRWEQKTDYWERRKGK